VREGGPTDIAVKLVVAEDSHTCTFEIVSNPKAKGLDPDKGTDVGKSARCPSCRTTVDSEFVKREAQEGRMGHQLYAVSVKVAGKWIFRAPTKAELEAVNKAEETLRNKIYAWEKMGLLPHEKFPDNFFDPRPIQYGMPYWRDLFNPRQLLTHLTYLEKFLEVKRELLSKAVSEEDREFYRAVITYGALVFDTCLSYNCLLSRWDTTRTKVTNIMELQAFPFKSSYAEWDHSKMLWSWSLEKVLDALEEIIQLLPSRTGDVSVYCGDAASIPLPDKSVDCIVVDPPYYENVMYSEVSDFFYVWLKRLIGDLYPEAFQYELTPKEEEAVANPARFKGVKKAKELANKHYESKIEACFREMRRVLRDDGVMTVMFTHRKAEAWASLAKALINAGFTFEASWPIATEPGQKFGKMGKGVLKYTVLLRCRKRTMDKKGLWEEVKEELLEEAERRVRDHSSKGITGPDLLVSVYGPVLGRFADYSQVKDASGNLKTPSDALNIVAEIVNKFLTQDIKADPETLAYINLLRNFPNLTVEYDLARLITVFGGNISLDRLDVKSGIGAVRIKGSKVEILLSKERQAEGFISPIRPEKLRTLIDVVHACLIQYENVGLKSVITLLSETGRDHRDSGFLSVLKAIAQLGLNGQGDKKLLEEARTAATLLEALGQKAPLTLAKGEKIDDYYP
jgi:adenine-specific DNA methylase